MDKYNQLKQSNLWTSTKLETSCLKDESHGQKQNQLSSLWMIKAGKTNVIRKTSYTCKNLKNGKDVKREEILVMYETNAFMSERTTLETNIMDDVNKENFIHTITYSIVNEKVMEINIHSSKFRKQQTTAVQKPL